MYADEVAYLRRELGETRHERDMAQQFQAAIWKVTTPGEPDQCIAALKKLGGEETDHLAAQLEIATADLDQSRSQVAELQTLISANSQELRGAREAIYRYRRVKEERDQLAAQLEIARKALKDFASQGHNRECTLDGSCSCGADFAEQLCAKLSDPAAALAEHDQRVAERYKKLLLDEIKALQAKDEPFGVSDVYVRFEEAARRGEPIGDPRGAGSV
jgi:chromosome segregation ATPase